MATQIAEDTESFTEVSKALSIEVPNIYRRAQIKEEFIRVIPLGTKRETIRGILEKLDEIENVKFWAENFSVEEDFDVLIMQVNITPYHWTNVSFKFDMDKTL